MGSNNDERSDALTISQYRRYHWPVDYLVFICFSQFTSWLLCQCFGPSSPLLQQAAKAAFEVDAANISRRVIYGSNYSSYYRRSDVRGDCFNYRIEAQKDGREAQAHPMKRE